MPDTIHTAMSLSRQADGITAWTYRRSRVAVVGLSLLAVAATSMAVATVLPLWSTGDDSRFAGARVVMTIAWTLTALGANFLNLLYWSPFAYEETLVRSQEASASTSPYTETEQLMVRMLIGLQFGVELVVLALQGIAGVVLIFAHGSPSSGTGSNYVGFTESIGEIPIVLAVALNTILRYQSHAVAWPPVESAAAQQAQHEQQAQLAPPQHVRLRRIVLLAARQTNRIVLAPIVIVGLIFAASLHRYVFGVVVIACFLFSVGGALTWSTVAEVRYVAMRQAQEALPNASR